MLNEMLAGKELCEKLESLPLYEDSYREKSNSERLVLLNDLYKIFIPSKMSAEIYSKLYLAVLRSLKKKEKTEIKEQQRNNFKRIRGQEYDGAGIIGGSDSFTIIGTAGIGKSTAIIRAMQLISAGTQEAENIPGYTNVIPYIICQCPFDCSVKSLLLDVLRQVDMTIGSNYYEKAVKAHATTDMLIGSVSQVAINHIGLLVVDEIQNVVNHKYGRPLVGMLTQLINNSGISICMVGTPDCAEFFESTAYLARRTLGLSYTGCEYGEYFKKFCDTLFSYQYVRKRTEITEGLRLWLYEHSKGVISVVVTLIHDAQEGAILDGTEALNQATLGRAYEDRVKMLHIYLNAKKKPKGKAKKANIPVIEEKDQDKGQKVGREAGGKDTAQKHLKPEQHIHRGSDIQNPNLIYETAMEAKKEHGDIAEALRKVVCVIEVEI